MKFLSARGIVPACVISAAAVAALAAPGGAGAALLPQCSGVQSLEGAGSSLQEEAINLVWVPGFNKAGSLSTKACNKGTGLEPKITYRGVGSGAGFKEWNVKEFFGTVGFVGTDNTVNPAEKAELEAKGKEQSGGKVLTVPVAQGSVAILVNLPEGCGAESTASKGRLALNQSTLEQIYNNEITEWNKITDDGDKFVGLTVKVTKITLVKGSAIATVASGGFPGVAVGATVTGTGIPVGTTVLSIKGNELELSASATKASAAASLTFKDECNPATAIKTVVRKDGSGTTHIFKRFLHWSNEGSLTTPSGNFSWNELSEAANSTLWPTGVGAIKGETGKGVVEAVEGNPGSIGYANLADARNPTFSTFIPNKVTPLTGGGEKKQRFWAVLENEPGTYADPSSNKDVEARAAANCVKTEYSNGVASFPPPSVESNWNEVTTKQFSKTYAICGLTYDLVFANYRAYKGTSQGEATTAHDYLGFVLDAKGGQKEINAKHDYLALPKVVLTKSLEGLLLINYLP
jgi:ABC-type phosphate transport system substrate-binding protein